MKCPGLHCAGCSGGTSLIPAAALGFGAWFSIRYGNTIAQVVDDLLITAGATVAVVLVLTITGLVRVHRRESLTRIGWHRRATKIGAAQRRTIPAPAAPALTTEQITGLAQLGQAVMDVRAHSTRGYTPATIIHDPEEIH